MARRAVPARVVAGGTNIQSTLTFEGAAPSPPIELRLLTFVLSDGEREPASCVILKSDLAPAGTVRSATQRRDIRTTQRIRFATQRRAILPLPKGEGGVRGKERTEFQCACELSLNSTTLDP